MKLSLIHLMFACVLAIAGQCNNGIIQAAAYWQINYPGNIPVGVPGVRVGPDTTYTVYLKMPKNIEPEWISAVVGENKYSVSKLKANADLQVGTLKGKKEPIVLSASALEQWWQLTLQKLETRAEKAQPNNVILLMSTWQDKIVTYPINKIEELEPVLSM